MKGKEVYVRCEYCNKLLPDDFDHDKQYADGRIKIKDGYVMLSKEIVAANDNSSHIAHLDGGYCNYKCFIKKLKAILKLK